jgi:hypothetical protein
LVASCFSAGPTSAIRALPVLVLLLLLLAAPPLDGSLSAIGTSNL